MGIIGYSVRSSQSGHEKDHHHEHGHDQNSGRAIHVGSVDGVVRINLTKGPLFILKLDQDVTGWAYEWSPPPHPDMYRDFYIQIRQGDSSIYTVKSPASPGMTSGAPWVKSPILGSEELLHIRMFSNWQAQLIAYPKFV